MVVRSHQKPADKQGGGGSAEGGSDELQCKNQPIFS